MTKRTRDDTQEFEKLAFGFAQTCKALGIEPDKEDVFKVFSLALDRTDNMSHPAALDHLQSFLSTKCVHGSHSHSTIKVKDFMVAFSHYLKDRSLPEMSSDNVLCELQAKGILQKLCTDTSVLALKDKMVFEGLNWVPESSPEEEDSACCIYILALEQGKLYVGKTSPRKLDARIQAHYAGSACAWTRKYPVVKVLKVVQNCTAFDEDKETIRMMAEHGWRDVRGGRYCQIELSASDIAHIESSIRAATDKCMKCGSDQHFVSTCPLMDTVRTAPKKQCTDRCSRCGRNSHDVSQCYATTNLKGHYIGAATAVIQSKQSTSTSNPFSMHENSDSITTSSDECI